MNKQIERLIRFLPKVSVPEDLREKIEAVFGLYMRGVVDEGIDLTEAKMIELSERLEGLRRERTALRSMLKTLNYEHQPAASVVAEALQ